MRLKTKPLLLALQASLLTGLLPGLATGQITRATVPQPPGSLLPLVESVPDGGSPTWPRTVAESSGFTRSSTTAEVIAFLESLDPLPRGGWLQRRVIGRTTEGRDLVAVTVTAPGSAEEVAARPAVLVNANIHGGEIEGKVAVQLLLREFAVGYHRHLAERLRLTFVPVYNADGNDRIARTNRVTQNGPDGGVGERPNAMGLDLNRDFVKVESPEARALTGLVNELRPIAFMDLHTTNGSYHGYDLTYSPSLSPNANPALDAYVRGALLPRVRERLRLARFEVFDYGNFEYPPRKRGSRGDRGDPVAWSTYDSRPRFGTNLMGLRDTVSILSEAYSYLPYRRRVEATYAFTFASLQRIAEDREAIQERIEASRAARVDANGEVTWMLGVDCELAPGRQLPVRVSAIDTVEVDLDPEERGMQAGTRRVARGPESVRVVEMEVRDRFQPTRMAEVGRCFVLTDPPQAVLEALRVHLGAESVSGAASDAESEAGSDAGAGLRVLAEDVELELRRFTVTSAARATRPFQGHREVSVEGEWSTRRTRVLAGSVVVPCTPLTAHLLHPESDDSLTTWNFFDAALFEGTPEDGWSGAPREGALHPVAISPVELAGLLAPGASGR